MQQVCGFYAVPGRISFLSYFYTVGKTAKPTDKFCSWHKDAGTHECRIKQYIDIKIKNKYQNWSQRVTPLAITSNTLIINSSAWEKKV